MKDRVTFNNQEQPCYIILNFSSDVEQPSELQLRSDLETGDLQIKTEALKKVIFMILSGEKLSGLLMTVIRFCLPLQDHTIKKLLLIYWEIVPKTSGDGKLLHEMILVCDAYRKDLQHPNEFIRGSTLRFLCKLRQPELLEPLIPAIRSCLEHKHTYVRRNAVLAIFTIYKNFEHLIPDAPELLSTFLEVEQDMDCRRNALLMLLQVDQKRALDYITSVLDQIGNFGDMLQLVIVKLVYKTDDVPSLRKLLLQGDFFIGAALSASLTKLVTRLCKQLGAQRATERHKIVAQAMFIMTSILRLGVSGLPSKAITADDVDRIRLCIQVLTGQNEKMSSVFTSDCRLALFDMLTEETELNTAHSQTKKKKNVKVQADDPISFLQLMSRNDMLNGDDVFEVSLSQALGFSSKKYDSTFSSSKLNKVYQLTGFSDPLYAEAYINVHQFDIVLDVLLVNQTNDTLQNCMLELATIGDLKLLERPQPIVLGPQDFANIRASIKVASIENGIIFGNIVYDVSGAASDSNVVVMSDIHIDIMNYILPATCTNAEFKSMWAELEWENKVGVSTAITDLHEYLQHLIKCTNMQCLTPEKALTGNCEFMAVTLYAKSIFGEDALANLNIEKSIDHPNAPISGHIRIRAKSQGMAIRLVDKINLSQKRGTAPTSTATVATATAVQVFAGADE